MATGTRSRSDSSEIEYSSQLGIQQEVIDNLTARNRELEAQVAFILVACQGDASSSEQAGSSIEQTQCTTPTTPVRQQELAEEIETLEQQVREMEQAKETSEEEAEKWKTKWINVCKELEESVSDSQTRLLEMDELEWRAGRDEAEAQRRIRELKELEERCEEKGRENQVLQSKYDDDIASLSTKISEQEAESRVLRRDCYLWKNQLLRCTAKLTTAEDKVKVQEGTLEDQLQQIEEGKQEASSMKQRIEEQDGMLKRQRELMEEAQREDSVPSLISDETVKGEEEESHPLDRARRLEWEIEERQREYCELLDSRTSLLRTQWGLSSTPCSMSHASIRSGTSEGNKRQRRG
jgi:DNA repair exonuclease SbcCD ATPase subunit